MRIGLVLAASPGYSETFFRSKILGLKQKGNDVIVFASGPANGFDLCTYVQGAKGGRKFSFFLHLLISLFKLFFLKPRRLFSFVRMEKRSGRSSKQVFFHLLFSSHIMRFDLDWLHFGFGTMAIGKENLAKSMSARMAVSLRGFDIAIYPLKHPNCYELMWKQIDKLHVLSDDLKFLAVKNGVNEKTPVVKITPAVDTEKFKRKTTLPENLHKPLSILTVARLHWKKGLEYILQSLAILKDQNIQFQYTIIGEGEEYERLFFVAHHLDIIEQVQFVGKKSPEEVKQAMEVTDIYLQYSISEGFCNAVLEAQAMGCLCVVSNAEGLPENVIHGYTGWVVPKRNPKLLAEQLIKITKMGPDKLINISHNAIQHVQSHFRIEDQISAFIDFYSK